MSFTMEQFQRIHDTVMELTKENLLLKKLALKTLESNSTLRREKDGLLQFLMNLKMGEVTSEVDYMDFLEHSPENGFMKKSSESGEKKDLNPLSYDISKAPESTSRAESLKKASESREDSSKVKVDSPGAGERGILEVSEATSGTESLEKSSTSELESMRYSPLFKEETGVLEPVELDENSSLIALLTLNVKRVCFGTLGTNGLPDINRVLAQDSWNSDHLEQSEFIKVPNPDPWKQVELDPMEHKLDLRLRNQVQDHLDTKRFFMDLEEDLSKAKQEFEAEIEAQSAQTGPILHKYVKKIFDEKNF